MLISSASERRDGAEHTLGWKVRDTLKTKDLYVVQFFCDSDLLWD